MDGTNVNVELVGEGYSAYETEYGRSRRYDHEFRRAEQSAQAARKGIWR